MHVIRAISSRVSSITHSPWSFLVVQTVYGCMGVWSDEGGIRACSRLSGYHCLPVMTSHECVILSFSLSLMVMSELVLAIDVSVQMILRYGLRGRKTMRRKCLDHAHSRL